MQHTPGPWRIEDIESTQPYTEYDVYADDHRVMHVHDIDDGAEANARLIAAAPGLLELAVKLQSLCPSNEGLGGHAPMAAFWQLGEQARGLIAKATGRGVTP